MVALVTMIVLSVVALYAIGLAADAHRSGAAVVPNVRRGARTLRTVGASWGPREHLR